MQQGNLSTPLVKIFIPHWSLQEPVALQKLPEGGELIIKANPDNLLGFDIDSNNNKPLQQPTR
jgi:hypothetical protein